MVTSRKLASCKQFHNRENFDNGRTGEVSVEDYLVMSVGHSRPLRKLDKDGLPSPGAFKLRDRDNGCLSVNWLEYFGKGDIANNIQHVRKELRNHYKTKKSGRLAVLNVGMAKSAVMTTCKVDIHIRSDPRDGHRSHACVEYPANDNDVATTLSEMVKYMYPAV